MAYAPIYEKLKAIASLEYLWDDVNALATVLFKMGFYMEDKKGVDRNIVLQDQVNFLRFLKEQFKKNDTAHHPV